MKYVISILAGLVMCMTASAQDSRYVSIEYGIVTYVNEIEDDDSAAEDFFDEDDYDDDDSVAENFFEGGLLGEVGFGDDEYYYAYEVELVDSGRSVVIRTEQDNIYEDDCVALERGSHSNIRPVSSMHCEEPYGDAPDHHSDMAEQCDDAKEDLADADGDELDDAIEKVRLLCED